MIYTKQNPETIQQLFNSIAPTYDKTNQLISFGLHKRWNQKLAACVEHYASPRVLLDLCSGTGEIVATYLPQASLLEKAILMDFSGQMLECARNKLATSNVELDFIEGDVQEIPLDDHSVDGITMAYGIRNVQTPQRCFKESYRVLTRGGVMGILELTRPRSVWLNWLHEAYLRSVLPVVGALSSKNKEAYRYLSSSIASFVCPSSLKKMLEEEGFEDVTILPLAGGIASIFLARKP